MRRGALLQCAQPAPEAHNMTLEAAKVQQPTALDRSASQKSYEHASAEKVQQTLHSAGLSCTHQPKVQKAQFMRCPAAAPTCVYCSTSCSSIWRCTSCNSSSSRDSDTRPASDSSARLQAHKHSKYR
eukprot:GHUV01041783.1.p1 GENE.GHUV01041783.1~~GHUV01041783.1.p1  ORF type:complete len:127 (+),score=20.82 GHUV01041783.1:517-897(+)